MLTLYHRTSKGEVQQIIKRGFSNDFGPYLPGQPYDAVWLFDQPVAANEGGRYFSAAYH
jgi:hypothetical protein